VTATHVPVSVNARMPHNSMREDSAQVQALVVEYGTRHRDGDGGRDDGAVGAVQLAGSGCDGGKRQVQNLAEEDCKVESQKRALTAVGVGKYWGSYWPKTLVVVH